VEERDDVISLQDYLVVLKRRRWLIAGVVVVVVAAALAVSLTETPTYESTAEVVVEPVRRAQDLTFDEMTRAADLVATEREIMTSRPVAARAAELLGTSDPNLAIDGVRADAVGDTRVVNIVAADTDPALAAARANAVAEGYLDYRRSQAMEEIVAARADLDARADELRSEIAALDADEDADAVELAALNAQLSAVVAQAAEVGNATGSVAGGGAVLSPAEVPSEPVSPQPIRTGALALVLGLMLGVGLAFLRDHVDDVVRDEADLRRATGGLPILGRIPRWRDPTGGDRLATVLEPMSLASEAYRELSAGVRFLLVAKGERQETGDAWRDAATTTEAPGYTVMLTSATAGDGKTSTAANLAVAAARVGLRTLLVDADLRRPTVAKRFGLGRTTGLSDVLLRGDDLTDHVVDVGVDNLRVLPAGTLPPNPNELLASTAMRAFERDVVQRADLVIYDSPAVLAVPDALELGRQVDVTIMVGRAERTGRRQLTSALERLNQVGIGVSGFVLNDLTGSADGYYYAYYYRDEQSEPEADDEQPGRRARRAEKKGAKKERGRKGRNQQEPEPAHAGDGHGGAWVREEASPPLPASRQQASSAADEPLFGSRDGR
jgi:polysaccharide biosynthesis transport protein